MDPAVRRLIDAANHVVSLHKHGVEDPTEFDEAIRALEAAASEVEVMG